jgi:hypothetical protein
MKTDIVLLTVAHFGRILLAMNAFTATVFLSTARLNQGCNRSMLRVITDVTPPLKMVKF